MPYISFATLTHQPISDEAVISHLNLFKNERRIESLTLPHRCRYLLDRIVTSLWQRALSDMFFDTFGYLSTSTRFQHAENTKKTTSHLMIKSVFLSGKIK